MPSMTLNISDLEMRVLENLCEKKGMSKTALLRQALRVYQAIDSRMERGEKLFVEDEKKKEKSELVIL